MKQEQQQQQQLTMEFPRVANAEMSVYIEMYIYFCLYVAVQKRGKFCISSRRKTNGNNNNNNNNKGGNKSRRRQSPAEANLLNNRKRPAGGENNRVPNGAERDRQMDRETAGQGNS